MSITKRKAREVVERARSYHHGDLRAELLRRAEETLSRAGVDGLSLRQLARDTGVSHAAPSRHFRDKQALLDALTIAGFERLGAGFEQAAGSGGDTAAFPARLRAMAHTYLRFAIDNPALLALMFARKNSSDPAIEEAAARAFTVPIEMVADAQAGGEVVPGEPRRICLSAVAALHGLAAILGSGLVAAEEADGLFDEMVGHMMDGLRPRR
ncbi:TetR/AcrR family transcriptional regulator [Nocardia yunnanensis]|uniref:TetR/AcrR family transcriptional regulator n=1 Tax=Nocardia yunnanensis TaxID=2382165 RepID=A0A386ZKH7_9NOCA|nr:TetR/AcrR family transcriptional regulator [Nocardia yunnanensis]AYF77783.1 TetR/AcrR family transcriptional regulator [Nocardia yunnanensis]